ncbi:hypothetical protein N473_02875 [Pseudoalteromonas luteoviolacea CPMOR-1]|uniref:CzcB-like barrel-sandwich hybrid domain-containing protein n=1 Tax=Pseudoalteromonas luteoviolacea CPMOR-1 TaxID=1365248 RepID=A0A167ISQ8_9GAMM|nr:efflux RND transporter periplasmic adaptor subunit [Pseudoalteromonas luteoviolacea]KZN59877.1 hypothetical protein N473_02875 [Pseudoalteromonas luteoviolacea CPMOR-1]
MLSCKVKSYSHCFIAVGMVAMLFAMPWSVSANQIVRVNAVYQFSTSPSYKAVGHVRAKEFANLAAAESGLVSEVAVNPGDEVLKGDALLSLDSARLRALLAKQKSEVERQKHIVLQHKTISTDVESDYQALRSTEVGGAVSQQVLRNAAAKMTSSKTEYEAAKALLESYESELALLEIRLFDSVIRAPFDGRVTERTAQLGEWLSIGESAIAMYSSNQLEAWIEVPARFSPHIEQLKSQPITVRLGELTYVSDQVRVVQNIDKSSGAFYLVADLPKEAMKVFPGMNLTAWVSYGERQPLLFVPQSAIVKNHLGTLVYKVVTAQSEGESEQQAVPVAVEPLFQQGNFVALAADHQLVQGDQVVVEGNLRLLGNAPVTVIETLTLTHMNKM